MSLCCSGIHAWLHPILAAVYPAVTIASCAADDLVAARGFGIFFGITFSKGAKLWKLILHGPIEVVIGSFLRCLFCVKHRECLNVVSLLLLWSVI